MAVVGVLVLVFEEEEEDGMKNTRQQIPFK
jgi:hypothetical protein